MMSTEATRWIHCWIRARLTGITDEATHDISRICPTSAILLVPHTLYLLGQYLHGVCAGMDVN